MEAMSGWNRRLFVEAVVALGRPPIYDGVGEEDEMEEFKVEDFYGEAKLSEAVAHNPCPYVHVELDEYLALWKPWRCAIDHHGIWSIHYYKFLE